MEGSRLVPGEEDITWPDQVAPRGRKASSTRQIKPQTSNLILHVLDSTINLVTRQGLDFHCGVFSVLKHDPDGHGLYRLGLKPHRSSDCFVHRPHNTSGLTMLVPMEAKRFP